MGMNPFLDQFNSKIPAVTFLSDKEAENVRPDKIN